MVEKIVDQFFPAVEKEFFKNLREEKLHAQDARNHLTIQKLTFATALIGLGAIKLEAGVVNTTLLAYLTPFVAIVFDFYILGEDYSVKRLGAFMGAYSTEKIERDWEEWVRKHRDPFAPWAMPILTTLITVAAALVLVNSPQAAHPGLLAGWALLSLLAGWGTFLWYRRLRGKIADDLPKRVDGRHTRQTATINAGEK
jgi:hypothetical protein